MAADRATEARQRAEKEDWQDRMAVTSPYGADLRALNLAQDVLWLLDERERLTEALRELDEFASNKAGYWQHPLTAKARALSAVSERKPA